MTKRDDELRELAELEEMAELESLQASAMPEPAPADVSNINTTPETETTLTEMLFPSFSEGKKADMPTISEDPAGYFFEPFKQLGRLIFDGASIGNRSLAAGAGKGDMTDPDANVWGGARQRMRDYLDAGMVDKGKVDQQKYANGHWTDQLPDTDPDKYLLDPRINLPGDNTHLKAARVVGDAIFDIAGDPTIALSVVKNAVKPLVKSRLKSVVEAPAKFTERFAGETGQVPREALKMWKTPEGQETLKKAWNQELPTAKEMVDKVFNAGKHLPEGPEVKKMLSEMPEMNMDDVIAAVRGQKKTDEISTVVEGYNKKVEKWAQSLENKYKGKTVSADRYRDMRVDLDKTVNFTADEKDLMDAAYGSVRRVMAQNMEKAAPEAWKGTMQSYSGKLNTIQKLKKKLGNNKSTAHEKAFSLLRTAENTSRQPTKEIMDEFDGVFGTDFSKRSEMMDLSRKLGQAGEETLELPILPKGVGSTKAWAILTAGLGSPRYAPKILKTMDKLESWAKASGHALSKTIDTAAKATALGNTIKNLTVKKKRKLDNAIEAKDEETINTLLGVE